MELYDIVKEIYRQARVLGMLPPNATRLVKLVYLADIEWRKTHNGEPISSLHWRFHLYGPYADEFNDLLGGEDVEAIELVDGKIAKRLTFADGDLDKSSTPENVSALLRRTMKEWGDANLNVLLNHVYFETEPMENAKRGDPLDFSNLRSLTPIVVDIPVERLRDLRVRLNECVARLGLSRDGIHVPAFEYEEGASWRHQEDEIRLPNGIVVKI